jgi:hypothetical protein
MAGMTLNVVSRACLAFVVAAVVSVVCLEWASLNDTISAVGGFCIGTAAAVIFILRRNIG